MSGGFRFDRFRLDAGDRRLTHDDVPVVLNARYFDALALLVREGGALVTKDRFLDEVWRGVPVTDEALTQCIKTLRRLLGDSATAPRFIETVPKHGYRFIATVEEAVDVESDEMPVRKIDRSALLRLGGAGTLGGGLAGLSGGLIYGFAAAQPGQSGMGSASVLLVIAFISMLVALTGAAGVAFGIAAGHQSARRWRATIGGALGGLIVGALVKLLGLDAFNLLFGRAPGDIAGAGEGALLGGAIGLGAWLAFRSRSFARGVAVAAVCGGAGGLLVGALGGRLMGGSLASLAAEFPGSRLRIERIGVLLGEDGFGPITRIVTGGLEGALFGGCLVGAMILSKRSR